MKNIVGILTWKLTDEHIRFKRMEHPHVLPSTYKCKTGGYIKVENICKESINRKYNFGKKFCKKNVLKE